MIFSPWPCPKGALHPNARLTPEAVRHIRASKASLGALAKKYRVNKTTIQHVRKQRTWASV